MAEAPEAGVTEDFLRELYGIDVRILAQEQADGRVLRACVPTRIVNEAPNTKTGG